MTAFSTNEAARLAALRRYAVLDSEPEEAFDRLSRLTARALQAPVVAISLVDADRVWVKSCVGFQPGVVPRSLSLCARTIASDRIYEITDARRDAALAGNPLLDGPLQLRFYAGAPLITPEGFCIGSLCVIDRVARPALSEDQRATLTDLASAVMTEMERRRHEMLQECASRRLTLINDILGHVGGAESFVSAIEAAMTLLCRHAGATFGHLWDQDRGRGMQAIALADPEFMLAGDRAGFDANFAMAAGQSDLAALLRDPPLIVPAFTPDVVARAPLFRFAHGHGVRSMVATPFQVGAGRYVLVLMFAGERDDLSTVAARAMEIVAVIRPALQRKQTEDRLALMNEVLACTGGAVGFVEAIEAAMGLLSRHLGALFGMLWTLTDDAEYIRLVGMSVSDEVSREFRAGAEAAFPFPAGQSMLARLLRDEGRVLLSQMTSEMAAQYPLVAMGRKGGMRSFVAQSLTVGGARYLLLFAFATERRDLEAAADLLVEVGQAIRPALQRKQAEDRLTLFRTAVEATADAVSITDGAGQASGDCRVLYGNPAFAAMTGYDVDEVRGRPIGLLRGPGTDPAAIALLDAAAVARRPDCVELVNYRRDGTPFWIELTTTPILDDHGRVANWIGVMRDITERRASQDALQRMTAALQERTTELTEVARLARIGSWRWRADENVLEWSDETFELFGVTRATFDLTEASFFALLHPDDRERARAAGGHSIKTGEDLRVEAMVRLPGGKARAILWNATTLRDADGRVLELRGYCQDVTDRREAEAALRHGEKLRALGKLTGGIAHDFNNQLTIILANLDCVLDGAASLVDAEPALEAARNATLAATEVTRRLLSFARAEPLRSEPTDLGAWLDPLCDLARRTLGARYGVVLHVDASLPACAVDRSQLESAVLNLIVNARDAMPRGGSITITAARLEVSPAPRGALADLAPGSYAVVAVRDSGPGMPAEVADRAFEPFFTTKSASRGTGLGLSMVLSFARRSGGTALLETADGHGADVKILLPL